MQLVGTVSPRDVLELCQTISHSHHILEYSTQEPGKWTPSEGCILDGGSMDTSAW